MLEIDRTRYRLPQGQYYAEPQAKNLIVLHFTAGSNAAGAYQTWASDQRTVATAYIVDKDGRVYECFRPDYWAYHIGYGVANEKRSIGIEIVNEGPLRYDEESKLLCWWPKNWKQRFCGLAQGDYYVQKSYRGFSYYAAMERGQQHAVAQLVNHLCQQYQIPKVASDAARRGEFDPKGFSNYKGICSHSNFRADKFDVGPAFDWNVLNAPTG